LDLSSNLLSIIENHSFSDLKSLTELYLYNNNLKVIWQELFSGLIYLKILYINENYIEVIRNGTFQNFSSLVELDLSNNWLERLDELSLIGLERLESLYLSTNEHININVNAFRPLRSLVQLDLSSNGNEFYESGLFDTLIKLEHLWLNKNDLKLINSQLLNRTLMLNLKEINLEYNHLSSLNLDIFDCFNQLERVCLYGNFIDYEIKSNETFANTSKSKRESSTENYEIEINMTENGNKNCRSNGNKTCLLVFNDLC